MSNPNNCNTCKHKQLPDGGWCYMFQNEPTEVCAQHTELRALYDLAAKWIVRDLAPYLNKNST